MFNSILKQFLIAIDTQLIQRLYAFIFPLICLLTFTTSHAQDTWTKKANFKGTARYGAAGFSIGTKGYTGTGFDANQTYRKDFWEYDPANNTWTQKADFAGDARYDAVGLNIGTKGYIGTGFGNLSFFNDFWEYDPITNSWTKRADFPGSARRAAVGFGIKNKGYLGTGIDVNFNYNDDFWEYNPNTNSWIQKADFGGTGRWGAVGLNIGNKGYIGTGVDFNGFFKNDFWEYNPKTDSWTQKQSLGGDSRIAAVGFSIGSKGYIGTGFDGEDYTKDFWEYDPLLNTWDQKADLAGPGRQEAVGFNIDDKGFIGTGIRFTSTSTPVYLQDFWEYTPEAIACSSPTMLITINIGTSTATLKWNAVSEAIGYQVSYKVAGTSQWITTNSPNNEKILTGLTPGTHYIWRVASICSTSPSVLSDNSNPEQFTTLPLRSEDQMVDANSLIKLLANPVQDVLTISLMFPANDIILNVYDLQGRLFNLTIAIQEMAVQMNTTALPDGLYTLHVTNKNNGIVEVQKFVKHH